MTSEVQIFGKDKIKLNILQDILGGMIKVGFQLNNGPVQDYVTEIHTDGKRVNVFGKFNISEDANEGDTITIRPIMIDTPLKLTFQSNAIFSGKKASIVRNATKMVDQEFEISSETMAIELVPQGKQCYLLKVTNGAGIADGVEEYYTPIFKNMSTMEYFSNGRTARTIYEKTAANLMRRVVRTEGLTEEEQKTIQMSDLLSEDECYSIVSVE